MSLLSNNHVDVILGSHFFEVVLRKTGLGAKIILQRKKLFAPNGSPSALPFMADLIESLTELNLTPKTPLSVLLMSDYVQYTTLPAQSEPLSAQDQRAYAKAAFEQLFGEKATEWAVAAQEAPPFCPIICAAIQQALLDTLYSAAEQTKLELITVAPFINGVVDAYQNELRAASGYLAVVEKNRLLLLMIQKGRPTNIAVEVLDGRAWDFTLMQMLTRAHLTAISAQKQQKHVYIHAPFLQLSRNQKLNSDALKGWRVQWLESNKFFDLNHLVANEATV